MASGRASRVRVFLYLAALFFVDRGRAGAPLGEGVGAADVDGSAAQALDDDAVAGFERRLALGRVGRPGRAEDLDRALVERALARSDDRADLPGQLGRADLQPVRLVLTREVVDEDGARERREQRRERDEDDE